MSFPVYLSTFVGRQTQLAEIKSLIRQKAVRLLTLTGPGGCGKTRLAYESLADFSGAFEDGTYWVELVGLSDPLAVSQSIAASLQVAVAPGQTPLEALTFFLQQREALIVLDNCEHLLAACAQVADALLRACPALRVLATSRQKLGVEGEQVWPVPPLSYPVDDSLSLDALTRYDALTLFAARAKLVHPAFEISPDNAPDLIRIGQLLEGMPLAIELAASWVNVLDVAQMAVRLENQLALLAQRGQSVDARHQSMRATIRWSHNLLSEAEKTLFRRLGVFAGGFSLEAAEAVCGGSPLDDENILGLIGRLIDQSLVVRERAPGVGSRYRQLESIRHYANEELVAAAEEDSLRDRHLAFFADLIQTIEPRLLGPDQKAWTDRLEADSDNLETALAWACRRAAASKEAKAREQGIRLATGLFWFWNYTDRLETGRRWYDTILGLPGLDRATSTYADLTRRKATFTWLLGAYPAAQAQLQASLSIAEAGPLVVAHATLLLGITALHQGQAEQAIHLIQQSEEPFRALGDRRGLIITLANLGGAFLETGNLEAARTYAETSWRESPTTNGGCCAGRS
jgi:non-specific serine/threonine protein kinase